MSYDYVKNYYRVNPKVGQRARHTETNRCGRICRERKSHLHYVVVRFDGDRFTLLCHPTALDYGDHP